MRDTTIQNFYKKQNQLPNDAIDEFLDPETNLIGFYIFSQPKSQISTTSNSIEENSKLSCLASPLPDSSFTKSMSKLNKSIDCSSKEIQIKRKNRVSETAIEEGIFKNNSLLQDISSRQGTAVLASAAVIANNSQRDQRMSSLQDSPSAQFYRPCLTDIVPSTKPFYYDNQFNPKQSSDKDINPSSLKTLLNAGLNNSSSIKGNQSLSNNSNTTNIVSLTRQKEGLGGGLGVIEEREYSLPDDQNVSLRNSVLINEIFSSDNNYIPSKTAQSLVFDTTELKKKLLTTQESTRESDPTYKFFSSKTNKYFIPPDQLSIEIEKEQLKNQKQAISRSNHSHSQSVAASTVSAMMQSNAKNAITSKQSGERRQDIFDYEKGTIFNAKSDKYIPITSSLAKQNIFHTLENEKEKIKTDKKSVSRHRQSLGEQDLKTKVNINITNEAKQKKAYRSSLDSNSHLYNSFLVTHQNENKLQSRKSPSRSTSNGCSQIVLSMQDQDVAQNQALKESAKKTNTEQDTKHTLKISDLSKQGMRMNSSIPSPNASSQKIDQSLKMPSSHYKSLLFASSYSSTQNKLTQKKSTSPSSLIQSSIIGSCKIEERKKRLQSAVSINLEQKKQPQTNQTPLTQLNQNFNTSPRANLDDKKSQIQEGKQEMISNSTANSPSSQHQIKKSYNLWMMDYVIASSKRQNSFDFKTQMVSSPTQHQSAQSSQSGSLYSQIPSSSNQVSTNHMSKGRLSSNPTIPEQNHKQKEALIIKAEVKLKKESQANNESISKDKYKSLIGKNQRESNDSQNNRGKSSTRAKSPSSIAALASPQNSAQKDQKSGSLSIRKKMFL